MIKILLGGSPCTHWSIAQKNDRETQPNSGLGWELFLNYKIALEKYKPDYFLYENNESASQAIKDEIARQLNVVEPDLLTPDNGIRMTHINSALLSAQRRERFYVTNFGDIWQPQDRGILLKDVLDGIPVNATADGDKARTLMAGYYKYGTATLLTNKGFKGGTTAVAEPVRVGAVARSNGDLTVDKGIPPCIIKSYDKAVEKYGYIPEIYNPYNNTEITNKSPTLTTQCGLKTGSSSLMIVVPICQAYPCEWDESGRPTKAISGADGKIHLVYEVKDGFITIKDKQYPIKLPDGFYIIRKLTVSECKRLQTIPDWYEFPVSDSQAYKMIGNGWTVEVIKHLLSHIPNIQNEEIEVLSMYDGMSCGQIALEEMGCNVVKYYATEIDKYAIQTTQHNFPNTIQLGDAFQVREKGWHIRKETIHNGFLACW